MKPHDQWNSADIADHARPGEGNDEMTDVPEKIWAWNTANCDGDWTVAEGKGIAYIPESLAQAMVAAAYADAAESLPEAWGSSRLEMYTRTLADARAALDARDKRVREDALREAAALIGVKIGHGGEIGNCQCGKCNARRDDHAEILALIEPAPVSVREAARLLLDALNEESELDDVIQTAIRTVQILRETRRRSALNAKTPPG